MVTMGELAEMIRALALSIALQVGLSAPADLATISQARPVASDFFPQWAPDGHRIVFESHRDGDPEIYVIEADGTAPVRLTHAPGRDGHPSYSHDGRHVVFQSPRANGTDTDVYRMDLGGR